MRGEQTVERDYRQRLAPLLTHRFKIKAFSVSGMMSAAAGEMTVPISASSTEVVAVTAGTAHETVDDEVSDRFAADIVRRRPPRISTSTGVCRAGWSEQARLYYFIYYLLIFIYFLFYFLFIFFIKVI